MLAGARRWLAVAPVQWRAVTRLLDEGGVGNVRDRLRGDLEIGQLDNAAVQLVGQMPRRHAQPGPGPSGSCRRERRRDRAPPGGLRLGRPPPGSRRRCRSPRTAGADARNSGARLPRGCTSRRARRVARRARLRPGRARSRLPPTRRRCPPCRAPRTARPTQEAARRPWARRCRPRTPPDCGRAARHPTARAARRRRSRLPPTRPRSGASRPPTRRTLARRARRRRSQARRPDPVERSPPATSSVGDAPYRARTPRTARS